MTTYTPGPWITRGPEICYVNQNLGLAISIATAYGENDEANASLMAAAPELLDALETLVEHLEYYVGDNEFRPLENAIAAINKARGNCE